ncbi:MAG: hypothetical protein ACJAS4_002122 [Bacteriovoracaceae bacterium]
MTNLELSNKNDQETKGNFMETTEKTMTTESENNHSTTIRTRVITPINSPSKSIRPQKSMMRVQSLKPKRLSIATKVSVKKVLS